VEPNAKVKTLIELRDEGGKSHGAGSAIVSIGKGRIVYVWFRLLNMDISEPLLFDILSAL
jgi:hypothetical protein